LVFALDVSLVSAVDGGVENGALNGRSPDRMAANALLTISPSTSLFESGKGGDGIDPSGSIIVRGYRAL
jgi:hypothetical protein